MEIIKNLIYKQGDLKLKQATLAFIASQLLGNEEKEDLEKIFRALDKNGDGHLSKDEILEGYEEHFGVPINEEDVDKMIKNVDIDGNGCIEYTEFVMATMNEKNMVTNDKLQAAFKMFDKDSSGTITADEIKDVLGFDSSLSSKALDQIIKEVDENGDGVIQYDEFVHMMRKLAINEI